MVGRLPKRGSEVNHSMKAFSYLLVIFFAFLGAGYGRASSEVADTIKWLKVKGSPRLKFRKVKE